MAIAGAIIVAATAWARMALSVPPNAGHASKAITSPARRLLPRYRALFAETHGGLSKLGVGLLTVRENGDVEVWGF